MWCNIWADGVKIAFLLPDLLPLQSFCFLRQEHFRQRGSCFVPHCANCRGLPEVGGVGSAGWSTDSCLNTAYLSEDVTEAEEVPDTGVSMAGALQEHKSQIQESERFNREIYHNYIADAAMPYTKYSQEIIMLTFQWSFLSLFSKRHPTVNHACQFWLATIRELFSPSFNYTEIWDRRGFCCSAEIIRSGCFQGWNGRDYWGTLPLRCEILVLGFFFVFQQDNCLSASSLWKDGLSTWGWEVIWRNELI